jgi:hypothetical protein
LVHHGQHHDAVAIDKIEHAMGKLSQQCPARFGFGINNHMGGGMRPYPG